MKPWVLILDFAPRLELAEELVGILEADYSIHCLGGEKGDAGSPFGLPLDDLASLDDGELVAAFLVEPLSATARIGDTVRWLREESAELPLFLVTQAGEPRAVAALLESGVSDFVTPPLKRVDILPRLWRLTGTRSADADLRQRLKESLGLRQLIGHSSTFLAAIERIPRMAKSDATVLIAGETGTGKEVCARAIHYLSPRSDAVFLPVNCGAIPLELIESELFGHERAAFTGASSSRHGLVHEAEGGTLFLDEIDALPPSAQVKLLRFLQEKEYRPLGSPKARTADLRLIAATNAEVEKAVAGGQLRKDLYYRLNVLPLCLPPLRERQEDILPLAHHFLVKHACGLERGVCTLAPEVFPILVAYDWPGNVRELEHVVERAVVLAGERSIIRRCDVMLPRQSGPRIETFKQGKARAVTRFERRYIENLLSACEGNISRAARTAQKNRRAFWELIRKHSIDAARFRPQPP